MSTAFGGGLHSLVVAFALNTSKLDNEIILDFHSNFLIYWLFVCGEVVSCGLVFNAFG